MSMCRVFSCVVGKGCLLWPVRSLGKTLLAFVLLYSIFQGQICLLLQVFLNFLLLHSSPIYWKWHLFLVLVLKGLVGLHRTIQKQESSRKTSISALLTMPKPLTVRITINCGKEMGIPDHLTCLQRNLCAGQKTTVRTRHGSMDWFQIRKGLYQGCILSPCLFIYLFIYFLSF